MSEHRRIPDWQWLEELLANYNITEKRTGLAPSRDFTGIEANLYTEIQRHYMPRKQPNRFVKANGTHTSEEYEDARRIHADQIETMHEMGYGLMLDGFTFYKYGYELEPWNYETNFTMYHAYEIHSFINQAGTTGTDLQSLDSEANSRQAEAQSGAGEKGRLWAADNQYRSNKDNPF